MQPNELAAAKINASLKILEWARDDIEPGIAGAADKAHIALAEAFREIYQIIGEAVQGGPRTEAGASGDPAAVRIGDAEQTP